jgi:hypothetical protein
MFLSEPRLLGSDATVVSVSLKSGRERTTAGLNTLKMSDLLDGQSSMIGVKSSTSNQA